MKPTTSQNKHSLPRSHLNYRMIFIIIVKLIKLQPSGVWQCLT